MHSRSNDGHRRTASSCSAVSLVSLLWSMLVLGAVATSVRAAAPPGEDIHQRIRAAFSPVGRWTITKMNVTLASVEAINPPIPGAGSGGAAVGNVTIEIGSALGGDSFFDVHSDGSIKGAGTAIYEFSVGAGSAAFSLGSFSIPIGAMAVAVGDRQRDFAITGKADLGNRTIHLNAFQPRVPDIALEDPEVDDAPLQGIIRPGGLTFKWPVWPAMTNTVGEVLVHGATLLYRVEGKVPAWSFTPPGGVEKQTNFWCEFEAIKHVDLPALFEIVGGGALNPQGEKGEKGDKGDKGDKGEPGERGAPGPGLDYLAGTVIAPVGRITPVHFDRPRSDAAYTLGLTPRLAADTRLTVGYADKTRDGFSLLAVSTDADPASSPIDELTVDWLVLPTAVPER